MKEDREHECRVPLIFKPVIKWMYSSFSPQRASGTHWLRPWVGHRINVNVMYKKKKTYTLAGN
jgi:hypothetical protein